MNQLKRDLNRPIKRVSIAVLVLFVILLVNVNYLQAVDAPSLANGPLNDRTAYNNSLVQRGSIVTADGVTIASSKASKNNNGFKYQRSYADGTVYAPVTGYDTIFTAAQAPNFATGVERAENSLLSGTGDQLAFRNFIDMITDKPQKGATVQVTINSKAQQAAYAGLQSILAGKTINGVQQVGGVVALNPSTGAILAMASYPSFDPNELAVPNTTTAGNLVTKLTRENPSPLLNNASQTTLPPGSTFKIVTTSTLYTNKPATTPQTTVYSPQPLKLPNGNVLNDDNNDPCGNGSGQTQIIVAFAQSCNTPFANIGMQLGGQAIASVAEKYGFNTAVDVPGVTTAASNFTAESDASFTAFDAIGQHDTTETPLQEAMIAATVANGGVEMKPYLVQQVTASDLSVVSQTQPQQLATPISPAVAADEKQMMIAVVQDPDGTANAFNTNAEGGIEIAGKTGTAQNGSSQSDAVFTAFAPADNPKIAVGVMIQGGGFGAQAAAPVAVAVIKAYLQATGQG
ncbi:MAG: penicillin-binding transpeptidase domain-containing protein [Trebonia sp.]